MNAYREIVRQRETYVCKCGTVLTKAIFKDQHKGLYCKKCREERYYADSKTQFDLLKDKDKVEIAKKLWEWNQARGRSFYHPNEKEYWFFLRYGKPEAYIGGISGGNRSGKSCTCTMDILMQIEGWHPLQKDNLLKLSKEAIDPKIRDWCNLLLGERRWIKSPPVHARVVAVDFPNGVEKFTGPEYKKWLTHSEVKYIGFDNEKKRRITWKNGSYVEFMCTAQELDAHGGAARDAIHIDEEPFEEYWTENLMRIIDANGRMVYGATAVKGVTWTENAIWIPGETGDKDIYTIEMSTYDNPVITEEAIEKIKRKCKDQVDIDIRIYGKRTLRGGHVYKMYKEEYPWVIKPFKIPQSGSVIMAIDTHPSTPHAVLWTWVDDEGNIETEDLEGNTIRTLPLTDDKPNLYEIAAMFETGTIPALKLMVRAKEEHVPWLRSFDYFLLEPGAWDTDQTKDKNEKTVKEQFEDGDDPFYPEKGSKDLMGGIYKVAELLSTREWVKRTTGIDAEDIGEFPRLMTFKYDDPGIEYLLYEKRSYHFPDPRKAIKQGKNPSQKPMDKDDHLMEDERRTCEYVYDGKLEEAMPIENTIIAPDGNVVDVHWDEEEEEYEDAILG